MSGWYKPDWDCPRSVQCLFTTRAGGSSQLPYETFNLADHVGDQHDAVAANRALLMEEIPAEPAWLSQQHTADCVTDDAYRPGVVADAMVTTQLNRPLVIQVADCLPVLFASLDGEVIGAAHAGWRGLAEGVIAETVSRMSGELTAWLGPCIGPCHYEVGHDVRSRFDADTGFIPRGDKFMMDLRLIARAQLQDVGVTDVTADDHHCTFCDAERFFSYRRDGVTGRMAALIWRDG